MRSAQHCSLRHTSHGVSVPAGVQSPSSTSSSMQIVAASGVPVSPEPAVDAVAPTEVDEPLAVAPASLLAVSALAAVSPPRVPSLPTDAVG